VRIDGRPVAAKSGDIFGRGRHADHAIEGSMISRKHAQIHRGPAGWFVTDLGSSNGLYDNNGNKTEHLALPAGTTHFTLGPPSVGINIDITIPDALTAGPTIRVPRLGAQVPEPPGTARVAPPTTAPRQPDHPTPLGFAAARPLGTSVAPRPDIEAEYVPTSTSGVTVRGEDLTVVVNGGKLTILQPTTLSLPAGSMTAIVGPSGCGKSTLANLLSGRSQPTTGTVTIDDRTMTPAVRRRIGVVPQYDAVHERLTVRQALEAAAKLRLSPDTSDDDIEEAVLATAAVLDLDERLDTRVAKLSGGQKKRVSVGYELVSEPIMMVLDEPTSGLDPGLEQDLIAELRALADRGTTTVLVTHSPEAAMEADLVVVMAPGGHLTYLGPPDQVLTHFGVDDWADVFSRLTNQTARQWAEHYEGTDLHRKLVLTPPPPAATLATAIALTDVERSWLGDLSVMTGRYLRSLLSDWRSLALLAAQAPILGLLFAAVLSRQVFATPLVPRTNAREFVLACVLAMVWIGASNSVREIVKERRTFLRERAVGVSASSLVASRWLVLAIITVLQAIVLYLTATSRQEVALTDGVLFDRLPLAGPLEMMTALALVGLGSVGIGLLISALVKDANKAMAVLPVVLIPVVLFSGLLIPTVGRIGVEQISWINPVQWSSSAAAVVADVLSNEGCNPGDLQAAIQQALLGRTVSCTNARWQPTTATQAVNLGVAALQLVVLIGLSFLAADRSTRNLRS
jgi:ABC-type multidrug transport system ATPase subunit